MAGWGSSATSLTRWRRRRPISSVRWTSGASSGLASSTNFIGPASKDGWLREISDNDGGNTAHYLAAMTFKYAATGDEKARQEALEAFKAMVWLDDITEQARASSRGPIWSVKGTKASATTRGSGGLPAKWYPTEDGLWIWKGDTSSDEVNGHYYSVSCSTIWRRKDRRRSAPPSTSRTSPRTSSTTAGCCGTWTASRRAGGAGTPNTCSGLTATSRAA